MTLLLNPGSGEQEFADKACNDSRGCLKHPDPRLWPRARCACSSCTGRAATQRGAARSSPSVRPHQTLAMPDAADGRARGALVLHACSSSTARRHLQDLPAAARVGEVHAPPARPAASHRPEAQRHDALHGTRRISFPTPSPTIPHAPPRRRRCLTHRSAGYPPRRGASSRCTSTGGSTPSPPTPTRSPSWSEASRLPCLRIAALHPPPWTI